MFGISKIQIGIMLALVVALCALGWYAKHKTEQAAVYKQALQSAVQTIGELEQSRARLSEALDERAAENERINNELREVHANWERTKNELAKTDDCVNAAQSPAVLERLRGNDDETTER